VEASTPTAVHLNSGWLCLRQAEGAPPHFILGMYMHRCEGITAKSSACFYTSWLFHQVSLTRNRAQHPLAIWILPVSAGEISVFQRRLVEVSAELQTCARSARHISTHTRGLQKHLMKALLIKILLWICQNTRQAGYAKASDGSAPHQDLSGDSLTYPLHFV
jgi:hypothetical protein